MMIAWRKVLNLKFPFLGDVHVCPWQPREDASLHTGVEEFEKGL